MKLSSSRGALHVVNGFADTMTLGNGNSDMVNTDGSEPQPGGTITLGNGAVTR
jgi:hypothetical protein